MVQSGQPIAYDDLQALATLANSKLTPATPYSFNAFAGDDKIGMPKQMTAAAVYGSGLFADGSKVTVNVYGYKTIGGIKTYTWTPLAKAFVGKAGSGVFTVTWKWVSETGTTAPDGYIFVILRPSGGGPAIGWSYFWKDIGNVETFTSDGTFDASWKIDTTLDSNNEGTPLGNLPCGHGAWLKALNTIWFALFTQLDLFGGHTFAFTEDWLLSGPWCVSIAPKCYLKLNGNSIYKNLQFIYSEADSITGNELSPEADMLATYIGVKNGANNFNWDANVVINGTITFYSAGQGQNPANWNLSASHTGIVITVNPFDVDEGTSTLATSFTFTFTNVQYTLGTPVVLTLTPLAGGSVINPGNPAGKGGLVNCTFTGDKDVYSTTGTMAIHLAGPSAKAAALPNTLTAITFTSPTGGVSVLESHHRSFCNGVFVANTLPTLGVMPYLDVDLPQYNPLPENGPFEFSSSRRVPVNSGLPYIASVDNRGALWPVFRDTDFTPDSVLGEPVNGSPAWQTSIATKGVTVSSATRTIAAFGHFNFPVGVPVGAADVLFLAQDPNVVIYAKANSFPSPSNFDASGPGGAWLSLAAADHGFETGTTWFYRIDNPTANPITTATITEVITDGTAPNGTFLPTIKDDDGNTVAQKEGYSYHFPGNEDVTATNPVPQSGYCVYSLTVRRKPVNNLSGVALAPSSGTAALDVKIGIMEGFGFKTKGTFTAIQTVTIPAGEASIAVPVFLPVISGTPLAYQCAEVVTVRALVNFQPMMHSSFLPVTTKVNGFDYVTGFYNGKPWYQPERALLFFFQGFLNLPILLPIAAVVYNDLESALNLL